jgi:hypothetical protein
MRPASTSNLPMTAFESERSRRETASEKRLRATGAEEIATCVHRSIMLRKGCGVNCCPFSGSKLVSRLQNFEAWACMPTAFPVLQESRVSASALALPRMRSRSRVECHGVRASLLPFRRSMKSRQRQGIPSRRREEVACAHYLPQETNVNLRNLPRLPIWLSTIKFLSGSEPPQSVTSIPSAP